MKRKKKKKKMRGREQMKIRNRRLLIKRKNNRMNGRKSESGNGNGSECVDKGEIYNAIRVIAVNLDNPFVNTLKSFLPKLDLVICLLYRFLYILYYIL